MKFILSLRKELVVRSLLIVAGKMLGRIAFSLFITTIILFDLSAQSFQPQVDKSRLSPEAYSFSNVVHFDEISNTGLIATEIPLFTLQTRDLSMPISLYYDHGGIKVDSRASSVGTGWWLRAGASIIREVKDLPDDILYGHSDPITGSHTTYFGWLKVSDKHGSAANFPFLELPPDADELKATIMALSEYTGRGGDYILDKEPDIYTVNINGSSVKFLFNENGDPKILGFSDYKIICYKHPRIIDDECEDDLWGSYGQSCERGFQIFEFVIQGPDGYEYTFDEIEYTSRVEQVLTGTYNLSPTRLVGLSQWNDVHAKHATVWHLSKIKSPTGAEMQLKYNPYTITEKPALRSIKGACRDNNNCIPGGNDSQRLLFDMMDDPAVGMDLRAQYITYGKHLSQILTDDTIIDFVRTNNREDLAGDKELNKIEIRSRINIALIKRFELKYEYVTNAPSYQGNRLFLKEILTLPNSGNSQNITSYRFTYNATKLPAQYATEQDYWGYYNDNNAQSLIPEVYVYPGRIGFDRYRIVPIANTAETKYYFIGANRHVNPTAIKAGMLEKIQYATGGEKLFEYEPNDYWDSKANMNVAGGGLRIKSVSFKERINATAIVKNYSYKKNGTTQSSGVVVSPPILARETAIFVHPNASYLNCVGSGCYVSYGHRDEEYYSNEFERWDKYTKRSSHPFNQLSDYSGVVIGYTEIIESNSTGNVKYEFFPPRTFETNPSLVKEGYVIIFAKSYCNYDHYSWGNIQKTGYNIFPFPQATIAQQDFNYGKLKTKILFNAEGTKVKTVHYDYINRGSNPEIIYGLVIQPFDAFCSLALWDGTSADRILMAWAKYSYLTSADAQISKVSTTTYEYGNESNSITEKESINYVDGHTFPREQILEKSTRAGIAAEEIKTYYWYPTDFADYEYTSDDVVDGETTGIKKMNEINMIAKPIEILSVDNNKIITGTLNCYALQPTGVLSTITTSTLDFDEPKSFASHTLAKINKTDIGGNDFQYGMWRSPDYDLKITANLFDNSGNPTEIYDATKGIYISYLWGYNNTMLIAEIANARFVEVTAALSAANISLTTITGENVAAAAYLSDHTLREYLNELRSRLPNARTTSYTYKPLIGISSITDTNGLITYYEYDDFGRLQSIKNNDGFIQQTFGYGYRLTDGN